MANKRTGRAKNATAKSDVPNLYIHPTTGIWRYKHPDTKKFHYLNRDYEESAEAAELLNARLCKRESLVEKVLRQSSSPLPILFRVLVNDFAQSELPQRCHAESTNREWKRRLAALSRQFGSIRLEHLDSALLSLGLQNISRGDADRARYKRILFQLFEYARLLGHIKTNPVRNLDRLYP